MDIADAEIFLNICIANQKNYSITLIVKKMYINFGQK